MALGPSSKRRLGPAASIGPGRKGGRTLVDAQDARHPSRWPHGHTSNQEEIVAERYRLERGLGRGSMGVVWAAIHVTLGQRVAIKLIAVSSGSQKKTIHQPRRSKKSFCT